ncbi:hypothetical protein [Croceicoccus sp. YJ47]|uniref:hypothetical protein n=1 Tax=Croceicoccus sp. YJ47 TaxID=2798724 RepID=UPI0019241037|nr:hypothetical protein [Croceicoccus sp. YJ47]QQN75061.1 hypothetical protein JD971_05040 [Croceicoccus sp. YJ47]
MPSSVIAARPFAEAMFVRLFRSWSAARTDGDVARHMHDAARRFMLPAHAAQLCAGLFQMVEDRLGRELRPECCCSRSFSPDEKALIALLAKAEGEDSRDPLDRCALSVCRAIGMGGNEAVAARRTQPPSIAPRAFGTQAKAVRHGL